jgi:hypothetical protein
MRPYVVKDGDYLDKLALLLAFDADEVWNASENAELKKKRDPNLLSAGDILYVPEKKDIHWLPLKDGSDNSFTTKVPRTTLRLVFENLGKPFANEAYVVKGMGAPEEGTTDGDGTVEVKVPVHVREIEVVFKKTGVAHPFHIGDMDPIDEMSGVIKRLENLGYDCTPSEDGDSDDAVKAAIAAFQTDQGLPSTGTMDDPTREALAAASLG